jgi:hypothetical protein
MNVALLGAATMVAPKLPSTTVTLCRGHGLRTVIGVFEPDSIATVPAVPLLTCTWRFEWYFSATVPSCPSPLVLSGDHDLSTVSSRTYPCTIPAHRESPYR